MQLKDFLMKHKYFLLVTILLIVILLLWSFKNSFSETTTDSAWDGVIARSFTSGTGSEENPYVISSAAEYAYFKQLLEGVDASAYVDKNYVIADSFNYGEYDISINNEVPFSGSINGNGNLIYNASISNYLFNNISEASISNINFDNVKYSLDVENGALFANNIIDTSIDMVIISGSALVHADSSFGGFVYTSENSSYDNIILNYDIETESEDNYIFAYLLDSDKGNNILIKDNSFDFSSSETDITFDSFENITDKINIEKFTNEEFKVIIKDDKFLISDINFVEENVDDTTDEKPSDDTSTDDNKSLPNKAPSRGVSNSSTITPHNSGIDGSVVYINDFTADLNYYTGLNFTEIRNTYIPNGVSTGFYDSQYLVKVEIIYDGADINNSSLVGAVSPINSENANKFIYYKYYPLERDNNGNLLTNANGDNYIRIELIDNPFSKRPYVNSTEYGFNGWVCNQNADTTTDLCDSTTISFKKDNYTRYMDIAIDGAKEIIVHLNASWYEADVVTSYYDISDFNSMSMQSTSYTVNVTETRPASYYWKQNYTQMVYSATYNYYDTLPRYSWYRTSQTSGTYTYIRNRNTRCYSDNCYVYTANTTAIRSGTKYTGGSVTFVPNFTNNGNNTETTINSYSTTYMNLLEDPEGEYTLSVQSPRQKSYIPTSGNSSAFFYRVNSPSSQMISTGEYYNSTGEKCTSTSGCSTAYKLVQSNDSVVKSNGNSISIMEEDGNGNVIDADRYYYLVTRDTNIFRYTSTTALSLSNIGENRPFTVTGTSVNGTSATGVLQYRSSGGWFGGTTYYDFTAGNDLVIENIKINGPDTTGSNNLALGGDSKTSQVIYANSNNVKIGRNVTSSDGNGYLIAESIFGGTNSDVDGTFKVIVESGNYYAYHSGIFSTSYYGSSNFTLNESTILGSDYDRVSQNGNNNLKFLIGLDGYAAGSHTAGSDSLFASFTTVKSGMYGYNSDGTPNTDNTAGMYIGGRASQCVNSITGIKVEGGQINTIVGGYGYSGSTDTNSTYIGMSGGTVREIYGGAGHSTTKGNRIINVTGGTVSYSVLGGSDSYSSTDTDDGVVQGSTLVYVGGNTVVGDGSTGELNGVESGSVFGAGGGNSTSTAKGTVYNSHVIINGGTIKTSVYGGGNYGSTGTQSSSSSSTIIDIFDGNIGTVYGGSKSAGFSKEEYQQSSIIDINVTGGTIGTIYGGSNTTGDVYGSVDIDITGGSVTGNVYGGGKGAPTLVSNNVDITIGNNSTGPTISGNVYGGSAFGTVNSQSNGSVNVTVNKGTITGNVFGGGEGSSTETPHVYGDIKVTINDGTVGNVFGGNDQAGSHTEQNEIYLNGGTINDVFGGGNKSSVTNTHVYLKGANVNNIYGGSNTLGDVSTSNVEITSGTVRQNVYGGNNAGGTTGDTNVNINGAATIKGNVYGGGQGAATVVNNDVVVTIGSSSVGPTIDGNVYGGSAFGTVNSQNSGSVDVTVNKGTIKGSVFGGGQGSSTVTPYVLGDITVTINDGDITSVFGGNDQAGNHTKQNEVHLNGGTIDSVYGGGNKSSVTNTHVYLTGSTVQNIYGGSNTLGDVSTTTVNATSGIVQNIYGGNNEGGTCGVTNVTVNGTVSVNGAVYGGGNEVDTTTTNVTLTSAANTIPAVYGGGHSASVGTSNIIENGVNVTNMFGGSNSSGTVTDSYITYTSGNTTNVYGGNNAGGSTLTSHITTNGGNITSVYGGGNQANGNVSNITVNNGTITTVFGGGNNAGLTTSNVNILGGNVTDVYGGSNNTGTVTTTNVNIDTSGTISNVYGGGNRAQVGTTNVIIDDGTIGNIYGGGNLAQVNGNTIVDINGGTVNANVFGGGNYGAVGGNSTVTVTDATVLGNAYAGGNGSTAIVSGDVNITVDGNTVVGSTSSVAPNAGCVFGGGNQAATGNPNANDSTSSVNIVGGTIYGNVYGGAKFSVIYGNTIVNIGKTAFTNQNLNKTDIDIKGNVFGGGEANSSGSEIYDWSFISVTKGVNITIDADTYNNFEIDGSFFGGGNASSASGDSYLTIRNYGSVGNPERNVSIQRVTYVTIDNSSILLRGAIDKANEYDNELFSVSRVVRFTVQNSSEVYFVTGVNLFEEFKSLDSNGNPAQVTIDTDTNTMTRTVDNRIYVYPGKNINISHDQQASSYGDVTGMTFFGLFTYDNNSVNTGIYDASYNPGDTLSWSGTFPKGSYVLGKHLPNHDITVNGFYTNHINADTSINEVDYIEPTPADAPFYRWLVGENVREYTINLTASKYSTLGALEYSFLDFTRPNTSFQILSFDSSEIAQGINLINRNDIPRIAVNESDANSNFGLSIEASNSGWLTTGKTSFYTTSPNMSGVTYYEGENSSSAPSMLFYLYHSKNITETKDLGTAKISVMAITQLSAIASEVERFVINVNMSTALFQTVEYEGAMTPGDKYDLFMSTATNITNKSKFSAYYSLYAAGENVYKTGYHRALTSTFVLPENTKITMLDFVNGAPEYYYHVITSSDVSAAQTEFSHRNECSYNFSMFTTMGSISSSSNYDDASKNSIYYNGTDSNEEFIIIVDFADTNITSDKLNQMMLIEIRDSNDEGIITVLGQQHSQLTYNVYTDKDSIIDIDVDTSLNPLYIGYNDTFDTVINYQNSSLSGVNITDTQYFDSKLGVQIYLTNSEGHVVSGTDLTGAYFLMDGVRYYPDISGYTHIKLADKVGNTEKWIVFNTENAGLATGTYQFTFEAFASPDGIYYSSGTPDYYREDINIINSTYGLKPEINDNSVIFSANNDKSFDFSLDYTSLLETPNIRIAMYRRKYDNVYDTNYEMVDFQDFVSNTLLGSNNLNEYIIDNNPISHKDYTYQFKESLLTGTYRISFRLYDGDTMIGEVYRYIIVK